MLPQVLKTSTTGLIEIGSLVKSLTTWAVKDISGCGCRSYHTSKVILPLTRVSLKKTGCLLKIPKFPCSTVAQSKSEQSFTEQDDANGSKEEIDNFYRQYGITVIGRNVPPPILSIKDANFPPYIMKILEDEEINSPTPIQSLAWSIGLTGRDFLGISPTGSGKTLAYVLPMVMRVKELMESKRSRPRHMAKTPFALVLAPTRELTQQIQTVVALFEDQFLRCATAFGGANKTTQLRNIQRGSDILIATPGRCFDFLKSGHISLDDCCILVLDEADRMLDMGFLPQIQPIISECSTKRQTLMWSATWEDDVQQISAEFLTNHIRACIGSCERKPNEDVKQRVVLCNNHADKFSKLVELLREALQSPESQVLIFCERKIDVDSLVAKLRYEKFKVVYVHGDSSQSSRDAAMERFRAKLEQILVATAVVSRGIDSSVTHVVNFDPPRAAEEYIHKIGRTGRMGKMGESITFVTPFDQNCGYLLKMLRDCNQEIPQELKTFFMNSQNSPSFKGKSQRDRGGYYRPKDFNFTNRRSPFGSRPRRTNDFRERQWDW